MFNKNIKNEMKNNKSITVSKLLDLFGSNSFFYLLFVITFITSIPSPSWGLGSSTIPGGLVVLFVSLQILLGFEHIYLPEFLQKYKIKIKYLKFMEKYLNKLKNKSAKNVDFFKNKIVNKVSALFMIPCAIFMLIPLIFTNWAPSFCVTLISISHILKNSILLKFVYVAIILMILFYFYFFKFIIIYTKKFLKKFNINWK